MNIKWIKVKDQLPKENELVMAYSNGFYICRYKKSLDWSFRKTLKFVNLLSSHQRMRVDNVTHWYKIPMMKPNR